MSTELSEPATSKGALLKSELRTHLKKLFDLQEERVHVWCDFDTRFKEYCLSAPQFDLKKLQLICKQISEKMNSISSRILEIKNMFSPEVYNIRSVYELVERLQTNEQLKFQTTLELYVCEQERLENLAVTDEHEYVYRERISSFKKRLNETKIAINECLEELRYEMFD